jgi:hypothetical protein
VVECRCGQTREITSADALAAQRSALVKSAVMPSAPPVGPPPRPVEGDVERRRRLAHDMWRRGAIDDAAYERALSALAPAVSQASFPAS